MRRNAGRWAMPIIASVLGLTLLTGCAINKGTALAVEFEDDWAGTPGVVEVKTTQENPLPFLGTSTGTLILENGTSVDRVTELANELRDYVARHDHITGRITADGITFSVVEEKPRAQEVLALWWSLTTDSRVVGGDIRDSSTTEADRWYIEVTTGDAAAALAVFTDAVAAGDRHQPLSDVTFLTVSTGRGVQPGLSVATDPDGNLPTEAIAAYQAVAERYQVVRATLKPNRVSIVVPANADQARASDLASSAAPNLGAAVEVTRDKGY